MKLYTYLCADGIVRTRCRRHILRQGRYAALDAPAALVAVREGDRSECYACRALTVGGAASQAATPDTDEGLSDGECD